MVSVMAFLFASSVPHRLRRFGAVLQEKTLMRSNTPRENIAKENKRHSNNYMASATATETAAAAKATAMTIATAMANCGGDGDGDSDKNGDGDGDGDGDGMAILYPFS